MLRSKPVGFHDDEELDRRGVIGSRAGISDEVRMKRREIGIGVLRPVILGVLLGVLGRHSLHISAGPFDS